MSETAPEKSAEQLREEAEQRAAKRRATEEKKQAREEAKFQRIAKEAFDGIWRKFGQNREKSRSLAFSKLLQDMTKHASELVPYYMTAKEFVSIISEIETHTKGDQQSDSGDPRDIVSRWLRGEEDMSRVPLENLQ